MAKVAIAGTVALTLALNSMVAPPQAEAILNSPNAQIARTVDAALRRSTPAFNEQVKDVQDKLENIQFQLRIPQRKPWCGSDANFWPMHWLYPPHGLTPCMAMDPLHPPPPPG